MALPFRLSTKEKKSSTFVEYTLIGSNLPQALPKRLRTMQTLYFVMLCVINFFVLVFSNGLF